MRATATDIRKAVAIFGNQNDLILALWLIMKTTVYLLETKQNKDFLKYIDMALLVRLLASIEEQEKSELEAEAIQMFFMETAKIH